jgi:hypothetical protein
LFTFLGHTTNDVPKHDKKVTHERTEDVRQVSLIRRKDNHDSVLLLIQDPTTDSKTYERELSALQILKGKHNDLRLFK